MWISDGDAPPVDDTLYADPMMASSVAYATHTAHAAVSLLSQDMPINLPRSSTTPPQPRPICCRGVIPMCESHALMT